MKLFYNCDEAEHICDKNQYKAASFWEQVKLTFHLIYCAFCRKYTSRNSKLTKVINKANLQMMPSEQKDKLKELLNREMSKQ